MTGERIEGVLYLDDLEEAIFQLRVRVDSLADWSLDRELDSSARVEYANQRDATAAVLGRLEAVAYRWDNAA